MAKKIALKSILTDKVSGSSELVVKINEYFLSNHQSIKKLESDIESIKKSLSTFEVVNSYVGKIEKYIKRKDLDGLESFLKDFPAKKDKAYRNIYANAEKFISGFNTVLTLSNSKTLLEVFKIWSAKNRRLKIIVCESRPKNEGVIFAKALAKKNIKVDLITDASMSNHIANADAVIIGADIILKNGNVVNKTGSKNAAIICKHFSKPFYVFTTMDKFTNKSTFKPEQENSGEILNKRYNNIDANNTYFEEIDKSLITNIFTDD